MPPSSTFTLSYTEESPTRWADGLTACREAGNERITVPIFWGSHESTRGIRDFSKLPRLKLEKFLQLAQGSGLELCIKLGFPSGEETLPAWTRSQPERTRVPASLTGMGPLDTVEVPSIFGEEFRTGFREFLTEALELLQLYRAPEGPVVSLEFDWGWYAHNLGATESPRFVDALSTRYQNVAQLNARYGTFFPTLAAAATAQGMRNLADRRPWTALFDYKAARRRALDAWLKDVGWTEAMPASSNSLTPRRSPWSVLVDPTLVEVLGAFCVPCAPGGFLTAPSAGACRLWEYLAFNGAVDVVDVNWLPEENTPEPESLESVSIVVAGKFLSSHAFRLLTKTLAGGGVLILPLGVPRFNEDFEPLPWGLSISREGSSGGETIAISKSGEGRVAWPVKVHAPDDGLWARITAMAELFLGKGLR